MVSIICKNSYHYLHLSFRTVALQSQRQKVGAIQLELLHQRRYRKLHSCFLDKIILN